jgi:hypothetical protein
MLAIQQCKGLCYLNPDYIMATTMMSEHFDGVPLTHTISQSWKDPEVAFKR